MVDLTGDEADFSLDHPVIGWNNLAESVSESAGSSDGYPASNMLTPATHEPWIAATHGTQYFYLNFNEPTEVDYVALAKHNLRSIGYQVNVGWTDFGVSPPVDHELTTAEVPASDGATLYRFTRQTLPNIWVSIYEGDDTESLPQIAVAYTGKLLVLPRKIYQGLTPITYARTAKATNGKSETGHFLGRIVLQQFNATKIPLALIDPAYFRSHIADFLFASQANPFFFSWRPETYPNEVGYCFMTNNPMPNNDAPHSLIGMQLEFSAVV